MCVRVRKEIYHLIQAPLENYTSQIKKYEKYFNFIVKYCITSGQPQITILRRFLNPTLGKPRGFEKKQQPKKNKKNGASVYMKEVI